MAIIQMTEFLNATEGWFDPIPLGGGEVPMFPLETIPHPGKDMIEHVSELVQCDSALPGAALLGIYAMALQGRVTTSANSQREETSLWIVAVAEVSERKSAAHTLLLKPVYEYETELGERMKSFIRNNIAKRKTLEARLKKLEQAAGKADPEELNRISGDMASLQRELDETPEIYPPRLIVDNCTEEALATAMKEQGERIAIVSAEPTLLQQMDGSNDRQTVLDVFLKGYSGEPMRTDRVGRGKIQMDRPMLTVVLAAQPGAVRNFIKVKRFEERGVLSRFSFIPCKALAGTRRWKEGNWNPDILRRYGEHIRFIFDQPRERELTLSPEALEIYVEHYNELEERQASGGDLEKNTWVGKQPGRALRLAAMLHCAETRSRDVISPDVMRRAVRLSEYLLESTLFVSGEAREPEELKNARALLEWMISEGQNIHQFRGIHRSKIPRRLKWNAEALRKHVLLLVDYGHLRRYEAAKAETYLLHPCYWQRANSVTAYDS